jgi:predicted GIY-YIG superfamily endonuclease
MIIEGYEFYECKSPPSDIPSSGGVYACVIDGDIEYIGVTGNLYRRYCEHKCKKFRKESFSFLYYECEGAKSHSIERGLIYKVKPFRNKLDKYESQKKTVNESTVSVRIRDELVDKLDQLAKDNGFARYQMVEFLIEEFKAR